MVIAFSIMIIQPSHAIVATNFPQPSDASYIVDLAEILDTETEAKINHEIAILQQRKNKSIYIVTVRSITKKAIPKNFKIVPAKSASRSFLESILLNWNVDQLNQGNSILFLVSVKDRDVEIRSGRNLKYIIPDRNIQGIIDKIIIPEFKQQNFNQGILTGVQNLITKINNPYDSSLPSPERSTWGFQKKKRCWKTEVVNKLNKEDFSYLSCLAEASYHGGYGNW